MALSLYFDTKDTISDYAIQIGQLSIQNANEPIQPLTAVRELKATQSDFRNGMYGDARLQWKPLNQQVKQYEIYRVLPDGNEVLMGATPNHVFYVPEMRRIDKEAVTVLKVVAVNGRYEQGQASSVQISWPAYPKPAAEFKADRTLVAPGDGKLHRPVDRSDRRLVMDLRKRKPGCQHLEEPSGNVQSGRRV